MLVLILLYRNYYSLTHYTNFRQSTRNNSRFKVCLRLIYIRAKAKAALLPTCCIVSNPCIYTTATAAVIKIKEKIAFAFALI